jgi:kynurenine aminotransferase
MKSLSTFKPSSRVLGYLTNVWTEFTSLANAHNAGKCISSYSKLQKIVTLLSCMCYNDANILFDSVNLGQGFPDYPAPDFVKQAAHDAIFGNHNQYVPSLGTARFRRVLSHTYSPFFGHTLNWETEILVSQGAMEGIYSTLQAIIEPNDEVIIIEPCYDFYQPCVTMSGGKPIYIRLKPPETLTSNHANDWKLDIKELQSKITSRTKVIMINTPQNPLGKVFSKLELEELAYLCQQHNLIVISDEVYDRLVYDGASHIRIASLPDMWQRTITVCSSGKTFPLTGWKVGWVIGPQQLIEYIAVPHTKIVYCVSAPFQEALATSLEMTTHNGFFDEQRNILQQRRDKLIKILADLGLRYIYPAGSYFILLDISCLQPPQEQLNLNEHRRDWQIAQWMISTIGVACIPFSAFLMDQENPSTISHQYVRLCFAKLDETLDKAAERLQKLRLYLRTPSKTG